MNSTARHSSSSVSRSSAKNKHPPPISTTFKLISKDAISSATTPYKKSLLGVYSKEIDSPRKKILNTALTTTKSKQEGPVIVLSSLNPIYKNGQKNNNKKEKENNHQCKRISLFGKKQQETCQDESEHLEQSQVDNEACPWDVSDTICSRYHLQQVLGQGSFGKVFKALDQETGQLVALKVCKSSRQYIEIAEKEINILESFSKADPQGEGGCARLKTWFKTNNRTCVVLELLSLNLLQLLKKVNYGGLPLDVVRKFAIQILNSLSFLKWQGVIHADLKPENIALKQANKTGIKLVDFGTSLYATDKHFDYIMSRFYRAPEVLLGNPYDYRIDMWSLGCVLAELYKGTPLFPGENQQHQVSLIAQCLGMPPESVTCRASRSDYFFQSPEEAGAGQPKLKQVYNCEPGSVPLSSIVDDSDFCSFLGKLLAWNPAQRYTPEQALMDRWILAGFPEAYLESHQNYVARLNDRLKIKPNSTKDAKDRSLQKVPTSPRSKRKTSSISASRS